MALLWSPSRVRSVTALLASLHTTSSAATTVKGSTAVPRQPASSPTTRSRLTVEDAAGDAACCSRVALGPRAGVAPPSKAGGDTKGPEMGENGWCMRGGGDGLRASPTSCGSPPPQPAAPPRADVSWRGDGLRPCASPTPASEGGVGGAGDTRQHSYARYLEGPRVWERWGRFASRGSTTYIRTHVKRQASAQKTHPNSAC
jgi:hypothetical protein